MTAVRRALCLLLLTCAGLAASAEEAALPLIPPPAASAGGEPNFERGLRQMQSRSWDAAAQSFLAALQADPRRVDTYHALAAVEAARGNILGARDILERGVAVQPDDPAGWEYLGRVYLRLADLAYARAAAPGRPAATAEASPRAGLEAALRQWLAAWQEKRSDAYLAFYAADFRVPGGRPLADWAAERRQRIGRAARIAIRMEGLRVALPDDDQAEVDYLEDLRADGFHRRVPKHMLWRRSESGWRIVAEESPAR